MGSSESTERSVQAVAVAGVAVAGVAVAWGISRLLPGTEPQKKKKMMKAPGKDGYIVRDDFEHDTASYFKSLRKGS